MSMSKLILAIAAGMAASTPSTAAQPGATPVPGVLFALKGCWRGVGDVGRKQVSVALSSRPILDGAMVVVDVDSSAIGDAKDRYSAHLVFGGADPRPDGADVMGFWADSFGGAYTALGRGRSRPDGLEVTYAYPDASFVNRWTVSGDHLKWSIVERDRKQVEKPFADYALRRASCGPAAS